MKVTLDKAFPIPAAPQSTWAVLSDIEAVASCMPGAKITERVDETHYKGAVTVKVGPATLSFRGEIEVAAKDAAAKSLRLIAKGTDSTGSSAASMDLTATVENADGGMSTLKGVCESSVSGKAAAFGGRLMNSVADQILDRFAANFTAKVAAAAPGAQAAPSPQPPGGAAQGAPSAELNGLALAWGAFRSWLRGIFGGKS
ncbi:MAG: SRPBCC family protein [Usitatibacter sp.]